MPQPVQASRHSLSGHTPTRRGNIYCTSVLDNGSCMALASPQFRTQDLTAWVIMLYVAIRQHDVPEGLVSDGGVVFKVKQALVVYERLDIMKHQIDKGQAW